MSNSLVIEKTALKLAKDYGDANYPYQNKGHTFYVINTTKARDDMRISRGRICVPVLSEDGRTEVMVTIPNTFIPVNIAESISSKELRKNSSIRKLIASGHIMPVPDKIAIKILTSQAGLKEQDRINSIEDELVRSQVMATTAGDGNERGKEEITRHDIVDESEADSMDMAELGLKGTKGAKIQASEEKKKSSTSKKVTQIMLQLNEEKNEDEAMQTLKRMKLRERHYMLILKKADKKFKSVRQYAATQLA